MLRIQGGVCVWDMQKTWYERTPAGRNPKIQTPKHTILE